MTAGFNWTSPQSLHAKKYTCGYCGSVVSSDSGWRAEYIAFSGVPNEYLYICPGCRKPTYFDVKENQFPRESMGHPVEAVPEGVDAIYTEARTAASAGAFTGCVLLCRTLLTHVAEEKGADVKGTFQQHIDHLVNVGAIPSASKAWVDRIRENGNRATHRLEIATKALAEEMLTFSEMVLKLIFEFPSKLPAAAPPHQGKP